MAGTAIGNCRSPGIAAPEKLVDDRDTVLALRSHGTQLVVVRSFCLRSDFFNYSGSARAFLP